jgi:type VI secretion system protein ImpL
MKRWLWPLIGLLLIGLIIWFLGPYIAIGDFKPFESLLGRAIALAVVMLLWGFKWLFRAFKAQRASANLAKQVVRPPEDPGSARASADAKQLQQRFSEAIDALQKSKKGQVNLYALPWYIIIGPPGSGKTTAIVNSGLHFPLAQKFGKEALRGVGGTRNCDWWFTDQAILLDTAGRYTTQDSDRASDAAGWSEFLALLRKYRKRRPINGVLVAMSLADIATLSESERAEHIAAIRARLSELDKQLKISVPVYLMLTKCDLIAGFTEFFDDLTQEGRAQVWGTTFPLDVSRNGTGAQQFPQELDKLLARVNTRMLARVEAERDVQRRAQIFGFPNQLAGVRRALCEFVDAVCEGSAFEKPIQLRGVYLTSGTQEGMPIDRLLGAIARTFGLGMRAVNSQENRGKAYFIQRLLTDVVFRESGLAGLNRRMEVQQALLQSAAYVGIVLIGILGIIALSVSYARNRGYLQEVATATQPLAALPAEQAAGDVSATLLRLDTYRGVLTATEKHRNAVPWSMRMGLYQGTSVSNAAHDAYLRELNSQLVPSLAGSFRSSLEQLASQPDQLYEYLKAYLMLGEPKRMEPNQFRFIAQREWNRRFADDAPTVERLNAHVTSLLDEKERIQPVALDQEVVDRARTSLRQASLPVLMYSRLKLTYAGDDEHAIHLDREVGLGGDVLLVRKSRVPLSIPFPALYTRRAFDEIASTGKLEVVSEFVGDSWVLGEGVASVADSPRLASELMRLYEDDYIRAWDNLLADLQPKPTNSQKELTDMMALLASPSSPLKRLLVLVEANTNLLKPLAPSANEDMKAAVAEKLKKLEKMFGSAPAAERPGVRTTAHFEPLHKLVDGPPGAAPIDQTMRTIGEIGAQLAAMGGGLGDTGALSGVAAQGQADALGRLRIESMQLPAPISTIVAQVGSKGEAFAKGEAGKELARRYRTEVASECQQLISGRFPFTKGSTIDVALADFGRLFGSGGVFDTFFRDRLLPLVDTSTRPWRWKEGAAAVGGSSSLLAQFQAVERIRQIYFRPGGQLPELRFNLQPDYLDATVKRLRVEIDGQILDYRHGPPRPQTVVWPGPAPGQAALVFEENTGVGPNRTYQGPWAAFRLFDDASFQPQSEIRYLVTLRAGDRTARVTLEASSVRNPFASDELRRFRCGT